ncbi:unnamed protein product [Plutella xylostella]|uniref:(diamondback moth) hypothetical protein n=1 Tax=Plutella xylostella TaxID=51655 RepID=A0A8S4G1W2_PLUXY|nr:unnamed protein product [Plutella xylostella]
MSSDQRVGGLPTGRRPSLGHHSDTALVHLPSCRLARCPAHLHFSFVIRLPTSSTFVPPIDYLRQVTLDLGGEGVLGALGERQMIRRAPPTHTQQLRSSVRALIRRFNEQVTLELGGEGVLGALGGWQMIRRAPPTHTQQLRSSVRALIRRFNEQVTLDLGGEGELGALGGRPMIRRAPPTYTQQLRSSVRALIRRFNEEWFRRQVTLELGGEGVLGALGERQMIRRAPPTHTQQLRSSVRALIRRFNEVSAWVTDLLLSQCTLEERKGTLACALRMALTCWNIGNFNGAMEIVAGLK